MINWSENNETRSPAPLDFGCALGGCNALSEEQVPDLFFRITATKVIGTMLFEVFNHDKQERTQRKKIPCPIRIRMCFRRMQRTFGRSSTRSSFVLLKRKKSWAQRFLRWSTMINRSENNERRSPAPLEFRCALGGCNALSDEQVPDLHFSR